MSALQKFKTFFSKNVLLCLTVPMVVFSLLVPQPFVWMGQNISIDLSGIPFLKENFPSFGFVNMLLCVIMFGMGMTLKADDFKYIFKKPTDVLIGICSQYVFMAGFGWLVASLLSLTGVGDPTVRAQIAVGLVLLGCVPGGTASNVMTFLAKGDVALSITITMCTTLLAPVLTPSLTLVLAGQWIDVNFWNMFISIVLVVLLPILLGIAVHTALGDRVELGNLVCRDIAADLPALLPLGNNLTQDFIVDPAAVKQVPLSLGDELRGKKPRQQLQRHRVFNHAEQLPVEIQELIHTVHLRVHARHQLLVFFIEQKRQRA